MTTEQIAEVAASCGWNIHDNKAFRDGLPTDVAQFRTTLEVAYQMAFLNERLDDVLNTRHPMIRVMVEPGDWPIQVNQTPANQR